MLTASLIVFSASQCIILRFSFLAAPPFPFVLSCDRDELSQDPFTFPPGMSSVTITIHQVVHVSITNGILRSKYDDT